jgi:inner membrane protein
MPMTTTHALLPVAVAVAFAKRPVPWTLVIVAAAASAAPDLDGLFHHFLGVMPNSIWGHRGATHSLFIALAAGIVAAGFRKWLGVRSLTAGLFVALAMASHGLLDMMTDSGKPVAYLWPLSSVRLFADWRPIHSSPVHMTHLVTHVLDRFTVEMRELVVPTFALAFAARGLTRIGAVIRLRNARLGASGGGNEE